MRSMWTGQLVPRGTKPTRPSEALAQMALDFLSAPATGTDVERLFSHGGLVVSKCCHNLSANSIHEQVVLSRWMLNGLIPEVALIKLLNKKHHQTAIEDSDSDNSDMEVNIDIEGDNEGDGQKVTQKKRKGKGKAVDLLDNSSDNVKMNRNSDIEISLDDDSSDEE